MKNWLVETALTVGILSLVGAGIYGGLELVGEDTPEHQFLDLHQRWVPQDRYDQWSREKEAANLSPFYLPHCDSLNHLPDAPIGLGGRFIPCLR